MELIYSKHKTEEVCRSLKSAKKYFGGNEALAVSLMSRINTLRQADTIKDIVVMPHLHFHDLQNKGRKRFDGYFAIDVRSRTDRWRIIIEPLDENKKPFVPCNIDKIANIVRIVSIREVSDHYE